ncbi:MAG: ABC transporter ATP-binding protein [Spirochaetales bacterium]|nr:ABC transporter ATP-binding protein [Spirochaetales bacterium]
MSKHFGGVQAVKDCSLEVRDGSITGLIGPNGAGKTTLFNLITGFHRPDSGRIFLRDQEITGLGPHEVFEKRLFRTFQIARDYREMSVLENLLLIPERQIGEKIWNVWFRGKAIREQERANVRKALEILEFIELRDKKDLPAKYLSGGEKKLLEIGRMMMVDLGVVLLDEPGAGVPPLMQGRILEHIRRLSVEKGLTLFIVEHDMDIIMNVCQTIIVMSDGSKLAEGTPEAIRTDERVIEAYLGTPEPTGASVPGQDPS